MSDLPSSWLEAPLDAIAEVILGQSPPGTSYNPNGEGLPFFQGKAEFGDMRPAVRKWTTDPRKIAQPHDVLLSVRAPVGPTNLAPFECAIGRGLVALRPLGEIDPRYLLYGIRATGDTLASRATGTTFAAVSGSQVRAHLVPLAPLSEQRRIVATIEEQFSHLDSAGQSLVAARRKLTGLREAALETAFAGDWPWTTLGEIAEIVGGVTKDAKRENDPSFVNVPYLRVANVQRGYLDLSDVATIRVPVDKAAALALRPGDVLFNEGGDRDKLGRGWIWSGEIDGCIHQNHVFRARLHDEFEPKFVSWHGNTFGRRWFETNGRQTTNLASLNLTTLKSFPVLAPTLDVQQQVVAELEKRLSELQAVNDALNSAKRRSAALRRSILERAFRGELVPQDADDEPASALLERIAAEQATAETANGRRPRRRATMQRS